MCVCQIVIQKANRTDCRIKKQQSDEENQEKNEKKQQNWKNCNQRTHWQQFGLNEAKCKWFNSDINVENKKIIQFAEFAHMMLMQQFHQYSYIYIFLHFGVDLFSFRSKNMSKIWHTAWRKTFVLYAWFAEEEKEEETKNNTHFILMKEQCQQKRLICGK